jgi:glycerol-3-phosphate acyltransferase PlsX
MVSHNRIVVDAMGGDFAPQNEVEGGLLAIQESIEKAIPLSIIYIGVRNKIQTILDTYNIDNKEELLKYVEIIDANEVITMYDDPISALKIKKDSSMIKGLQLHQSGQANGYISAGNTGATLTLATIILGKIKSVLRPTIGVFLPTSKKKPIFLIDVGATSECKARFLYEYAVMGSILCNIICSIDNPSIGLLNVGEENSKGTAEHIEAYKKLTASELNFFGNIEGNDILTRKTDIVITDGYTGNVILKFAESFITFFKTILDEYIASNSNSIGVFKEKIISVIKEIMLGFDPENTGGVPLLGVKGNVIIGHGNSSPTAIKNMIMVCCTIIEKELCNKIELGLNK